MAEGQKLKETMKKGRKKYRMWGKEKEEKLVKEKKEVKR